MRQETAALRNFNTAYLRFGSGADITRLLSNVRFTPKSGQTADVSICPLCAKSGHSRCSKKKLLFDHVAGGGKQRRRHVEAERPGGLEIDDQLELGW